MIDSLIKIENPLDYRQREEKRLKRVAAITILSISSSLLITYITLWLTNNPMMPIIFIIAALAPAIISPIVSWSISGLIIKVLKLEESHRYLANHDELTGLASRRAFFNQGETLLNLCNRSEQPLTFAYLDLDHFKDINDTYSHAGGDAVLKAFGQLITSHLRSSDLAGRLGGEEFALVLPNTTANDARVLLERIRHELECSELQHQDAIISLTLSAGLSQRTNKAPRSLYELMNYADEAMYVAKSRGRNCIAISSKC